jgi:branched-chain amino acid transport system permease protein
VGLVDLAQALVNGVCLGTVIALASVGLALVFGAMALPNFAHGDLVMLGMYVGFFCWQLLGLDPLVAVPVAAGVMAVVGWLLYRGTLRQVLDAGAQTQIIVTVGLSILLRGLAQLLFTADSRRVDTSLVSRLRLPVGGVVFGGPQLAMAAGAVACTAAVAWLVHRTELGHALQAVGEDRGAAALMGIRPQRLYAMAWGVAGATTGVAGALLLTQFTVDPTTGANFGLLAFASVALGGFGSVVGTAVAGVVLGAVQGVVGLYWPPYTLAAALGIYLVVLVVRPHGLWGTR